mgnify:CR=1 FL=1
MDDNQIKDYLQRYEIKSEDGLANHILQLKTNTFPNIKLISELVWVLEDKESVFYSFLAENKNKMGCSPTPSKEFYNAFKQTTSSPTFMDEVLEQANKEKWNPLNELHERAGREMFNTIKDEDGQFNSTRQGETHTEVPNFEVDYTQTTGYKDTEKFILLELNKLPKYKETDDKELLNDYVTKIIGNNPPFRTVEGTERQGEFATMGDMFSKVGKKEKEGKLHYELSWEFIEEMAKRMANNKSDKYPLYNWKQEINVQDLKDAINRHHVEVMKGNYKDGDEILGHIVQYACNSMMLWEQLRSKS